MRTLSVALLCVILLPVAAWANCTGATPTLCLSLNQSTFQAGQALHLSATVTPGSAPPVVDVYVALSEPPATLLFLQGNGAFTTDWVPFVVGWSPTTFSGQLFNYTFGGGEPGGTYTWYAAFATHGTQNWIGGIASAPFQFTPPTANLSGTYALSGTITQSGCPTGYNGTFSTSGQLTLYQTGTNLTGNGTIYTPGIGSTSSVQFTGTVSGNSTSGSFTSNDNYGDTGTGFFSGGLSGNTLTVTASGTNTGTSCYFSLSLSGNRP